MTTWAISAKKIEDTANRRGPARKPRSRPAVVDVPGGGPVIQRKPTCACGGGCPRCQSNAAPAHQLHAALLQNGILQRKCGAGCDCEDCGLQTKVKVGPAADAFEQEADALADRVVNGEPVTVDRRTNKTLHTKPSDLARGESKNVIGLTGGQRLPASVQREFGPRLGGDLSDVRVHTGADADAAASSVGARAFTLGSDLVFASGEYAPDTMAGRRLIAHELVHWVQQGGRGHRIQRNLKVDKDASDDKGTAISQMTPLLGKICPDFYVDPTNGIVSAKAGSDCEKGKFGDVANGKQKLGCCCLCTLTRGTGNWKIIVTINDSPSTYAGAQEIKMIPTSGPSVPDLRSWSGGPTEKLVSMPPEEALGHEMCGHAALHQINAHPADQTAKTARTFSDVHDPTVRIENALAGKDEMNLGGTPRGLAASSTHHGESLRVFVVKPFAADDATISATAQAVIDGAATFADANADRLIDVVGFSDNGDKNAAIGRARANAVRKALEAKLKNKDPIGFHLSPGAAETKIDRIQPAVDGGAGNAATVEIRLVNEPAGLVNLPKGVSLPNTVTHVDPKTPAVVDLVKKGKGTGNACHDLLIKTAWDLR